MKKNKVTLILSFFSFLIQAQTPLVKQWDKRFGGNDADALYAFQQIVDGGYILGGFSQSDSGGDKTQPAWANGRDFWIVKTDASGNKLWDKNFGGLSWDELYTMQQTSDGGFILGGYSFSNIGGDKTQNVWGACDFWIVKTDSLGNKLWDMDFGGTLNDELRSVQQTFDNGYILGGFSNSDSSGNKTQPCWGNNDFWIVKTDSLGNKEWDKRFGGTDDDRLYALRQTADGGYILGGLTNSGINGDKTQPLWGYYDYWVIKIDSAGNKQWEKDLGGYGLDMLFSLDQTNDNGYILGGSSYSGIGGDKTQPAWGPFTDYWIVKIDSVGNKQWDKDFGGYDKEELYRIIQQNDNGYLISGDSYSDLGGNKTEDNLGSEQAWIVKTDSLGNLLWDKTIFTSGHDESGIAIQTTDGCYTIANHSDADTGGYKTQFSRGWYDYWIVKFCDTTITTNIYFPISTPQSSITISPNPATNNFTITFPNIINTATVSIYNIVGETIFKENIANTSRKEITLTGINAGFYFVRVSREEGVYTQKLVVQ